MAGPPQVSYQLVEYLRVDKQNTLARTQQTIKLCLVRYCNIDLIISYNIEFINAKWHIRNAGDMHKQVPDRQLDKAESPRKPEAE